jgi:hypothetical protein
MLWLASPSLDARVLGWSFFDGTAGAGPQVRATRPTPPVVAALVDGWRLLQMSPLVPPTPGHERETSFLKHEFVFERMVDEQRHPAVVGRVQVHHRADTQHGDGQAGAGECRVQPVTQLVAPIVERDERLRGEHVAQCSHTGGHRDHVVVERAGL